MNIAYFLLPKSEVAFIFEDYTLRQGIEKMRYHGYAAVPVLSKENRYIGTISEGDFLWYLVDSSKGDQYRVKTASMETVLIKDVMLLDRNPPVHIDTDMEELLQRAMQQNFVPVIDDRGMFIGLITRKDIIKYLYGKDAAVLGE